VQTEVTLYRGVHEPEGPSSLFRGKVESGAMDPDLVMTARKNKWWKQHVPISTRLFAATDLCDTCGHTVDSHAPDFCAVDWCPCIGARFWRAANAVYE